MSGPARMLDDAQKREIVALVSIGTSKTLAAQYVGCSVSTIYRERRRDPEFRQSMERGAAQNIVWLKQTLRRHAEKSWHAAAWLLEREYPHLYGRRDPVSVTPEQVQELAQSWWDLVDRCPYERAKEWLFDRAEKLSRSARRFAAAHALPFERDGRPHSADWHEMSDEPPLDPDTGPESEAEFTDDLSKQDNEQGDDESDVDCDHDPRAFVEPTEPPRETLMPSGRVARFRDATGNEWSLDAAAPPPVRRGNGTYDFDRLRETLEFCAPRPNPLSADWLEYCREQGITPEQKTRLEAEALRRERASPLKRPPPK